MMEADFIGDSAFLGGGEETVIAGKPCRLGSWVGLGRLFRRSTPIESIDRQGAELERKTKLLVN
jgi:hypothetical protein